MPVYRYTHTCGYTGEIFLKADKESIVLKECNRCGRSVSARQVRDKSIQVHEKDGVTGLVRSND